MSWGGIPDDLTGCICVHGVHKGCPVHAPMAPEGLMIDGNPFLVWEQTLSKLTPESIERIVREMEAERRKEVPQDVL